MLNFLSDNLKKAISYCNSKSIYEIRLRADKPIRVLYEDKYVYLGKCGITNSLKEALFCSMEDIADCIFKAGKYSVYSVEEQIKKGFITFENGERIGLAGEYVFEKGQPLALRNFTSICIRVPHEVVGCGLTFYNKCMSDRIRSVLLMSSPGLGKTTMLRDVCRILSEKTKKNILICDERGEISVGNLGESCDVLKFCNKSTAFEAGIRALRPDIIVTDEITSEDCSAIKKAIFAGVTVLASAHFSDIKYVKPPFLPLFERYVLLKEDSIGKIAAIYNEEGEKLPYDG